MFKLSILLLSLKDSKALKGKYKAQINDSKATNMQLTELFCGSLLGLQNLPSFLSEIS